MAPPPATGVVSEKALVTRNEPLFRSVMGPKRKSESALAEPEAVRICHAHCKNRYSPLNVTEATWVEALDVCATVVSRFVIVEPMRHELLENFVISVACEPERELERQIRHRRFPAPDMAADTAIMLPPEYHVPAEKTPVKTLFVRKQSMAKLWALWLGGPTGSPGPPFVKLLNLKPNSIVSNENEVLVVPGKKPVVEVEAVGWFVSSKPALEPDWIGLLRKKVSMLADIKRRHAA